MKSTVKKVLWHPTVDHSIVWLIIPIFGVPQKTPPVVNRLKIENRRFRLPVELLRKTILLSKIRDQIDDAILGGAASVQASWSKVDNCYKTPHKVESMTPEEVLAASVNAPKCFWNHFEGGEETRVLTLLLCCLVYYSS